MNEPTKLELIRDERRRTRASLRDAKAAVDTRLGVQPSSAPVAPRELRHVLRLVEDLDELLEGNGFPPGEFPAAVRRKLVTARRNLTEAAQALGIA